jgi:hypothetical protein
MRLRKNRKVMAIDRAEPVYGFLSAELRDSFMRVWEDGIRYGCIDTRSLQIF